MLNRMNPDRQEYKKRTHHTDYSAILSMHRSSVRSNHSKAATYNCLDYTRESRQHVEKSSEHTGLVQLLQEKQH